MSTFSIHAATIGTATLPVAAGTGAENSLERRAAHGAGELHERGQFTLRSLSSFQISSPAVKTLLSLLDEDSPISPWAHLAATIRFGKELAGGDGYSSSTDNISWAMATACIYLTGLAVDAEGLAEVSLGGIAFSADGTTDPVNDADAALPGTITASGELWRLASLTVDGTAIDDVESLSLSIDPKPVPLYDIGTRFPKGVVLGKSGGPVAQSLTIQSEALDVLADSDRLGSEADVVFTLKLLNKDGSLASDTLTFTLTSATIERSGFSGSPGGRATATLTCTPRLDSALPVIYGGL